MIGLANRMVVIVLSFFIFTPFFVFFFVYVVRLIGAILDTVPLWREKREKEGEKDENTKTWSLKAAKLTGSPSYPHSLYVEFSDSFAFAFSSPHFSFQAAINIRLTAINHHQKPRFRVFYPLYINSTALTPIS